MKIRAQNAYGSFAAPRSRIWSLFGALFSLFFFAAGDLYGARLTLAWDINGDSLTKGYKVYYGTKSGTYDTAVDVGNQTQYEADNLKPATIYFLAATAYDADGNESSFSEEIAANTQSDPVIPNTPPDSDNDGISDEDETNIYGTDPYNADTDGDGIGDGRELQLWGANWNKDNDGDGTINLLDPTPDAPKLKTNKVNMQAVLALLLE
jgi:hypothetical protein